MKNIKKKIIIGNWRAREDSERTLENNETIREFIPSYTSKYSVWIVEQYIKDNAFLLIADCGCHKNSEKNAKEIVKSHNKRKNKNRKINIKRSEKLSSRQLRQMFFSIP